MKNSTWVGLIAAAFLTAFGLVACSDGTVNPASAVNNENITSSYELLVAPIEVTDATIEQEMMIHDNMGQGMGEGMGEGMGQGMGEDMGQGMGEGMGQGMGEGMGQGMDQGMDKMMDPSGKMLSHPFGRLLKALNLTDDQVSQVRGFLADHDTCVRAAMGDFKASMRGIIARAKAARAEVLAALQAGDITREQAREKIRAINADARAALKNSDARNQAREAMKACDDEFLASLKGILTEEQLAILERYLANRSTGTRG
ncbi:MAG: hypothetical protein HYX66_06545 [Ignavibacteria bacterium]|nr:hypothetical protein [Ignavibacteria bacterium]